MAGLDFRRWNIELDLGSIKVDMPMDLLACMSPEMVEQEIWAHLLGDNAVRSLMADAAREHGQEPRHLSFKGAMPTVRALEGSIRVAVGPRHSELSEPRRRSIASHRVGDRPGRFEPREKKRRPKPHRLKTVPRREPRKLLLQKA